MRKHSPKEDLGWMIVIFLVTTAKKKDQNDNFIIA